MQILSKAVIVAKMVSYKITGKIAKNKEDYDVVSSTYDSYFTKLMGSHTLKLLGKLEVKPGDGVLDLACGTGFGSSIIAEILDGNGSLVMADQSSGMLGVARERLQKFPNLNHEIHQTDVMEFLEKLPSDSFNVVFCGWAICYMDHPKFMTQINRVLKKGGKLGIIDTRKRTEMLLMDAYERVILKNPSYVKKYLNITHLNDADHLKELFIKNNFAVVESYEGMEQIPSESLQDIVDWIEKSGISTDYVDVIDRNRYGEFREKIIAELTKEFNSGNFELARYYVAGVASKI